MTPAQAPTAARPRAPREPLGPRTLVIPVWDEGTDQTIYALVDLTRYTRSHLAQLRRAFVAARTVNADVCELVATNTLATWTFFVHPALSDDLDVSQQHGASHLIVRLPQYDNYFVSAEDRDDLHATNGGMSWELASALGFVDVFADEEDGRATPALTNTWGDGDSLLSSDDLYEDDAMLEMLQVRLTPTGVRFMAADDERDLATAEVPWSVFKLTPALTKQEKATQEAQQTKQETPLELVDEATRARTAVV
jgi:hypothetical protein